MRVVKEMKDVQLVLNELLDFKTNFETRNVDLHGRRFTNAGPSQDLKEYVTRGELNNEIARIDAKIKAIEAKLVNLDIRIKKLENP